MKILKPIAKIKPNERYLGLKKNTINKSKVKAKKYSTFSVVKLRPNSIQSERILSEKISPGKTSKAIVSLVNDRLKTKFFYDGRLGRYLIYKAKANEKSYYYVLHISNEG
ncbi:MAG: hypothetical protein VB046_06915 [Paludibacter sp.]|nr:hypothetical protein [Paludibacter sp.]